LPPCMHISVWRPIFAGNLNLLFKIFTMSFMQYIA
jgi:hypothetical protein